MTFTSVAPWIVAMAGVTGCVAPNSHGVARGTDGGSDVATAPADVAADGDGDVTSELPPALIVDAPTPPPECAPHTKDCTADGRTPRACSDDGRWQLGATCAVDDACTAGRCLCAQHCDEGSFVDVPASLGRMSAAGDQLFFTLETEVERLNLNNRLQVHVALGEDFTTTTGLTADGNGSVYWCRTKTMPMAEQLMVDAQVLETVSCSSLHVAGSYLYIGAADGLSRRALAAPAALEHLPISSLLTFEIAGDHLYYLTRGRAFFDVHRAPLADLGQTETLTTLRNVVLSRIAVDQEHVYLPVESSLLRIPVTGAPIQEVLWRDDSVRVVAVALSETHVYFSTETTGVDQPCAAAGVLRLPKGERTATPLSSVANRCPADLLLHGDRIYAGVVPETGNTSAGSILRIRQ